MAYPARHTEIHDVELYRRLPGRSIVRETPRLRLPRRSEELQGNVVWVTKRLARAVRRVDDSTVDNAEAVQVALPLFKFGPVGTREGQMIQSGAAFVEWFGALQVRELVDADQGLSHEPYDVV